MSGEFVYEPGSFIQLLGVNSRLSVGYEQRFENKVEINNDTVHLLKNLYIRIFLCIDKIKKTAQMV